MNTKILMAALSLFVGVLVGGCEYTTVPAKRGGLGESCLARNDCGSGLSCINGVCVDSDVPIDHADKQCDLVECTEKADCNCDPDETCRCVDNECEVVEKCVDDSDCFGFGFGVCVTGECADCRDDNDCFGSLDMCVSNQCVQCKANSDCDSGEMCLENFCREGCSRDEQCGPLQACTAGECVEKDCESDRECVAYLDNPRASCGADGQCTIKCESDAECNADGFTFSSCVDGACAFLGCETNAECRAYFGFGVDGIALCRGEKNAK